MNKRTGRRKRWRELGNRYYQAQGLDDLGEAYRELGDLDSAHSVWLQALALLQDLPHPDTDVLRAKIAQLSVPHDGVPLRSHSPTAAQ